MLSIMMPRLSDTMTEGAIARWLKHPGDTVAVGDVLVEIETDKATMELEAYEAGTLHRLLVEEGTVAEIGTPIALLDDGSGPELPGPVAGEAAAPAAAAPAPAASPSEGHGVRPPASPLVRRIAREEGLDLSALRGSGPGGRIIRADVEALRAAPGAEPAAEPLPSLIPEAADFRQPTRVPFDGVRRVIAARLAQSARDIPHFSVTVIADAGALLEVRARLNRGREEAGRPRIGVNDLLLRASALALRAHPGVNASHDPEGGGATLLHSAVNIGIAVAAPAGLVVPVIRDADIRALDSLATLSRELIRAAQDRTLTPERMAHGTFTVSNLGMFGVAHFDAIINPPQGAILAVGAILAEPVVRAGAVVPGERMRLTLSADHRIIDGALAAEFLATLRGLVEDPWRLLG